MVSLGLRACPSWGVRATLRVIFGREETPSSTSNSQALENQPSCYGGGPIRAAIFFREGDITDEQTTLAAKAMVKIREDLAWRSPRNPNIMMRYVIISREQAQALLLAIEETRHECGSDKQAG
jgi:hypothetical protein